MSNNPILWQASPEQAQASAMYQFMRKHDFDNYDLITLLTCYATRALVLPSFFVAKMETGAS